ncbi:transcription factor TGA1-like isoform X1 [Iris pallida]|nr:transcription factor TGA1-like isoform X1 [Iris pallida]
MEYAHWVDEQNRQIGELRAALQAHVSDIELRMLVESGMSHYDDLFRIKAIAAKSDVFYLMSGMWKTAAERFFLWIGGFRPSELLKVLCPQLDPLTEQQLVDVYLLQHSSQQAEGALSEGMDLLQQTLAETLTADPLGTSGVANYMGQMANAMGKLEALVGFVHQADHLRQQTLQQMYKILTTRQAARCLLALGDYCQRLRALSSLWVARPREAALQ